MAQHERIPEISTPVLQPGIVRVLVTIATRTDEFTLALKQELTNLSQQSGEATVVASNLQIVILEQPGLQELTQALAQNQYQILHYIGNRDRQCTPGEELNLFNHKTNLSETLTTQELTRLLVNNHIQMAVCQFCQNTATNDSASSDVAQLAASLVKDGIKMVLAIPESIPNAVAITLMRLFYQNLSQGYPIDFCLCKVREELIYIYGLEQLYWALALLFLQPDSDGYLLANQALSSQLATLDLLEEDWEDSFEEINEEDPTYLEDSDVISDLFSQLAVAEPAEVATSDASNFDHPLPQTSALLAADTQVNQNIFPASATANNVVKLRFILASAVAVIAILSLWWFFRQPQPTLDSSLPNVVSDQQALNTTTANITAIAITKLQQGDLTAAKSLVEELLNRRAHKDAAAALNAVLPQQANTSDILFLRGRLAWQLHKVEDARQYWEAAVKNKPNAAAYHNAVGFAYYTLNNLDLANEAWFQALYVANQQQVGKNKASNVDALNAYAGLALVLHQAANDANQPTDQQAKLKAEAIKLRQKVLAEDSINFQVQNLNKKWLWNQKAIQDWRSLLQITQVSDEVKD